MNRYRLLRATEIDCRVSRATAKGLWLLLYKDARCDQNILDETVGPLNWQKSYQLIDGQLFCTISVWDEAKQQWISKQDVGVESNTEAEKGRASDAQKRAAFAHGIGRELYSAPDIWVPASKCNLTAKGQGYTCYDRFKVTYISYDDESNINGLQIVNASNGGEIVYELKAPAKAAEGLDDARVRNLQQLLYDANIDPTYVYDAYKVENARGLTVKQYVTIVKNLDTIKDSYLRSKAGVLA